MEEELTKPTPAEEKLDKKLRDNLRMSCNGVLSAWSFKQLHTWADVYHKLGYGEEQIQKLNNHNLSLDFPSLRAYLDRLKDELEVTIKQKYVKRKETLEELAKPEAEIIDESGLHNKSDYGLLEIPGIALHTFHYWFQKKAIKEIVEKIVGLDMDKYVSFGDYKKAYLDPSVEKKPKSGVLLLAGTGTGKTFITAAVVKFLWELGYHEDRTLSHMPYLYITRATVVEQASRVLKNFYNTDPINDCSVINIEQLRSKAGQFWIKEETKEWIEHGEEKSETSYKWKPMLNPCVAMFDESQAAKNQGSIQTKIMVAFTDLKTNAQLVSISATPFTRVCEARCFAVSTHRPLDHLGMPKGTVLNNSNWPVYAKMIAAPADPEDYNESAIERLMKDLEPWVVRVRGVRPQFEADNKVEMIDFANKEEFDFYHSAWERFLKEKAKAEEEAEKGTPMSGNFMFVILLKFAMAAELCRAPEIARRMYKAVMEEGKAAVCACKFKGTIIKAVQYLNEMGVNRNNMSLIWGGGQTQLTKKQKVKKKLQEMGEKLEEMDSSSQEMIEAMGLEDVEDREIQQLPAHLRLGEQSLYERQKEIDNFQSGKSLFCFYTFRAGGVGLSLHHSDEMTKEKCRRKESGYAVEEDISKIPVRPRKNFVAPTYSAIELVQGLGRCPRLTSLSPTEQTLLFYRGTIEADIASIVSQKLRCLSKVVKMREKWEDVIVGGPTSHSKVKEHIDSTKDVENDESSLIDEGESEEEE